MKEIDIENLSPKESFIINRCKIPVRVYAQGSSRMKELRKATAESLVGNKSAMVLISGSVGAGKTTFALALCEARWKFSKDFITNYAEQIGNPLARPANLERVPVYKSAAKVLLEISSGIESGEGYINNVIKPLIDEQYLIFDEFHRLLKSKSAHIQELLFAIVDERHSALKPTILMSNMSVDAITELAPEIGSRIREEGNKIIDFDDKDFRGEHENGE